jgi:hypothetical protein
MERRKFTRFRAQDDAFAALRGSSTRVGRINDISTNGLAFKYHAEKVSDETFDKVDIFLSNDGFHMSDVPCRIVCDKKECVYTSQGIALYRCGLKFEKLNEKHKNKLEIFLNNYTTGVID